jgi:23S rRNA pseudouridine1911/1915/1917 synthase
LRYKQPITLVTSEDTHNLEQQIEDSDDLFEQRLIVVDKGQTSVRIDKFLFDKLERLSRNKIQAAIKSGAVVVNESTVKPNYKIRPGENIRVVFPSAPKDETVIHAQNIPLDIVYEDDSLMVIYKPAGMVVHPGVGNESGTLVNALAYYLHPDKSKLRDKELVARPSLVHRIDKDTTGLMVVPKTEYAASHLAKQFFDHTVDREYRAIVWGSPEQTKGTITGNLARDPKNRFEYKVTDDGSGKYAVTHYETIESYYYVSLIKCKLETGRTHQIRVHMKHIGHTLFNDERYGGNRVLKGTLFTNYKRFVENCFEILPRQALHALSLGFTHPETGKRMYFETELPKDMSEVLLKWRNYLESRKKTIDEST